jgi:hypothetical protein
LSCIVHSSCFIFLFCEYLLSIKAGAQDIPLKTSQVQLGEWGELLQESRLEKRDTKPFQEAIFISVLAVVQQIYIQRLSPENNRVLPYIPLQAGYNSKKQGLTQIRLHATL